MFLLICKLYICIQNVFGHIFYSTRLHLYQQVWQFEVQKLAYMLILAAGGMIPYLSSVRRVRLNETGFCQLFVKFKNLSAALAPRNDPNQSVKAPSLSHEGTLMTIFQSALSFITISRVPVSIITTIHICLDFDVGLCFS